MLLWSWTTGWEVWSRTLRTPRPSSSSTPLGFALTEGVSGAWWWGRDNFDNKRNLLLWISKSLFLNRNSEQNIRNKGSLWNTNIYSYHNRVYLTQKKQIVFKGSHLVYFTLFSVNTQCIVLKSHDIIIKCLLWMKWAKSHIKFLSHEWLGIGQYNFPLENKMLKSSVDWLW